MLINKKSISVLKTIRAHKTATYESILKAIFISEKNLKKSIQLLRKNGCIKSLNNTDVFYCRIPYQQEKFEITVKGLAFLEDRELDTKRFWIPIIISGIFSFIAIIISIISLCLSVSLSYQL